MKPRQSDALRLDLPRQLLVGSAAVSAVALLVAALVASWRADRDVRREMEAAMDLARVLQQAHVLAMPQSPVEDEQAVERVRQAVGARSLRHLAVTLRDESGRRLLALSPADPVSGVTRQIVDWHRQLRGADDPAPIYLALSRPDGSEWSLVISPSPDSERSKAVAALLEILTVLSLGSLVLVVVMGLQIRWLMRPMSSLLRTLALMRQGQWSAPEQLPALRLRELQAVADALTDLGAALEQAERDRQLMAQRLLTLQEDERRRIAQELHDELGQRLTALRLDATVLHRRLKDGHLPGGEDRLSVSAGLVEQVQEAQEEIRDLVRRLAPHSAEQQPALRLTQWLHSLRVPAASEGVPEVILDCPPLEGQLPHALMMAVFRLSQEAVTNALAHSGARTIRLRIHQEGNLLHWCCTDDGCGIADIAAAFRRGNGLAGMRQRAWAFGADLQFAAARPGWTVTTTIDLERVRGVDSLGPSGGSGWGRG